MPATPPPAIEHPTPVDADARRVMWALRLGKLEGFTKEDCEKWRWKGALQKCPRCGDRVYLHGCCFGCGRTYTLGSWRH